MKEEWEVRYLPANDPNKKGIVKIPLFKGGVMLSFDERHSMDKEREAKRATEWIKNGPPVPCANEWRAREPKKI